MSARILRGDCRTVLPTLDAASVHCCVTSPPYFGLRDYGTGTWSGGDLACEHKHETAHQKQGATSQRLSRQSADAQRNENFRAVCGKCGAVRTDSQIGLEPTLDAYVAALVGVFREVRRVLRDDGTLWLNLGDSYASNGGAGGTMASTGLGTPGRAALPRPEAANPDALARWRKGFGGAKSKDLLMVPATVALALRADGWWLRSDIIWSKPNPMPESVTDRPTSAHEHIFLLAKSERYYFDAEAVREPTVGQEPDDLDGGPQRARDGSNANEGRNFRPRRSGNKERRIASGLDRSRTNSHLGSGVPWEDSGGGRNIRNVWTVTTAPLRDAHFATFPPKLIEPCILAGCPTGGTVLDPFFGAGTTALVADRLGRDCIGIDLNPGYAEIAERRIRDDAGLFAQVAAQ